MSLYEKGSGYRVAHKVVKTVRGFGVHEPRGKTSEDTNGAKILLSDWSAGMGKKTFSWLTPPKFVRLCDCPPSKAARGLNDEPGDALSFLKPPSLRMRSHQMKLYHLS